MFLRSLRVALIVSMMAAPAGACGSSDERAQGGGDDSGIPDGGTKDGAVPPGSHGFRADWYDVFSELKLTRVEKAASIAHDAATGPAPGVRGILYSVRWTAQLETKAGGEHAFYATADDGVRIFVDDKPVIDDWQPHVAKESTGRIALSAGVHVLRVEYFQLRDKAAFSLEWQPPGGTRTTLGGDVVTALTDPPKDGSGAALAGPRPAFSNPVYGRDCPDPGVLAIAGEHPLFAMVCTGLSFPIRLSDDLVTWRDAPGSILPNGKTAWSLNGARNWAPEIHRVGAKYVAYFTAVNASDKLSIGCASAAAVEGPYKECPSPMVEDALGVIDATFFEDTDGKKYLYYKIDGNSRGQRTPMYVRELAPDGLSFAAGGAVEVLNNDAATWEGGVVEAPWVVKHGAEYFMFYSGNVYDERYRTGVARAPSPKGPFTKKGGAPILANSQQWVGPGHGSVVRFHDRDVFVHHAWATIGNGLRDEAKGRLVLIAPITWAADGWPVLGKGTSVSEPILWP